MSVKTVRRIAARVLKVGESRIKIKPDEVKRAAEALTTDDVRTLIREKVVWAERVKGVPRIRARLKHRKKKQGRRGSAGSRKGAKHAGCTKKDLWKAKTRLQRRTLKDLKDKKALKEGVYRKAYSMIKGNAWRSRAAMLAHFEDAKWFAKAKKAVKKKAAPKAAPPEAPPKAPEAPVVPDESVKK
jgi:large subunit ribosomal protein L19e